MNIFVNYFIVIKKQIVIDFLQQTNENVSPLYGKEGLPLTLVMNNQ